MSDEKPDLTKTEMRQANSKRTNLRVLIIGIVVVAIGFAIAIWYNTAVTPETETTTPAGETIEDPAPAEDATDMEDGALPVPTEEDDAVVEEPAPTVEEPVLDTTPDTEETVIEDEPAVEAEEEAEAEEEVVVEEEEPVAQ